MTTLAGIRSIRDLELAHKRVLIRVDFNVPLDRKKGTITDDTRIREALPTIKHAVEAGARVILASHLGRPKAGATEGFSLEPCGARLAELGGYEVFLPDDCVGDSPRKVIQDLREGQICLLENLRYHEGEEKDDDSFARQLAELCDAYVNDAFGAAHRAHASVSALPRLMRERAAGLLLEKEVRALGRLVTGPEKPYVAVLGGAKVSDKIAVIESLLERVDALLIGGAMANTFLKAQGKNTQLSRVEEDRLPLARNILKRAEDRGVALLLPTDVVVSRGPDDAQSQIVKADAIPPGRMALDIGPDTIRAFSSRIDRANTVFWNGPMGFFEQKAFAAGTMALAEVISKADGFTVVGGGDSAAAVAAAGEEVARGFKHISTGGGASLELIEGRKLPGVEALRQ